MRTALSGLGKRCDRRVLLSGRVQIHQAMTLFSISCETCSARLKVRSVRALGQIIACPKCGSMLQVVPPEGWEAPTAKPAAEAPAGDDAFETAPEAAEQQALEQTAEARAGRGVLWAAVGAMVVVLLTLAGGGLWLMQGGEPLARNDGPPLPMAALPELDSAPETPATDEATSPADQDAGPSTEAPTDAEPVDGKADPEKATPAAPADQPPAPVAARSDEPKAKPASEASKDSGSPASDAEKGAAPASPVTVQTPPQAATEPAKVEPPAPRLSSQDLRSRLGTPLAGLKFNDVPLAEVLETLSQLAGVPIALDAHHVPDAGRLAAKKISADLQATTVGAAAASVTRGLGLEGVLSDGQVLLVPRGLRAGKPSKQSYDLAELTASLDETQVSELRAFLSLVAGAAPPSAREFALNIEPAQHRLVAESIARLRAARQSSPSAPAAKNAWDRSLTLNFREATPVVRILGELEQEAQATVLVDWPSLVEVGLGLDSQVSFVVHDQPLSEVFAQFASAQKLAWVRLDDNALLLTSPAAAGSFRQVRSYSLATFGPQVRDAAQLTATLRAAAPGEPPQVWLDPVSKTALVVGSAELHEQIARSQAAAQ